MAELVDVSCIDDPKSCVNSQTVYTAIARSLGVCASVCASFLYVPLILAASTSRSCRAIQYVTHML